jgi:hypothetical protein
MPNSHIMSGVSSIKRSPCVSSIKRDSTPGPARPARPGAWLGPARCCDKFLYSLQVSLQLQGRAFGSPGGMRPSGSL